jgi:hypothetical protein
MVCPGAKLASFAGLESDGAESGPPPAGLTVSDVVRLTAFYAAVIVTAVLAPTVCVVTAKVRMSLRAIASRLPQLFCDPRIRDSWFREPRIARCAE